MKTFITTLIFLFVGFVLSAQDKVYFTNQIQNKVERTELDGSNLQIIAEGQITLRRIRVDQKNEKVYWVEASSGILWQADLDGGFKTPFLTVSSGLAVIEIDTLNNRILFAQTGYNTIQSVDMNGQNIQTVVNESGFVLGIDYDPVNDLIYWTANDAGTINSANGDGSNSSVIASNIGLPFGLALDVENQIIYYSSRQTFQIHKINTAGVDLGVLPTPGDPIFIGDISLDVVNQRMYWIEGEPHVIKSAKLDGTDVLIVASTTTPYAGLDVAPTPPIIQSNTTDISQSTSLDISPNPTSDFLNLHLNNKYTGTITLSIFSLDGSIKSHQNLQKTTQDFQQKINTQFFVSGVYLLQIKAGKEMITRRFVQVSAINRP
jgi:Secretion system C-terminal sorting domain/Domain of unknown function (DUF5050)